MQQDNDGSDHLALRLLNLDLHALLRKVSITSMQYMLVALQYEASSYSISTKCGFCNFTLL